MTKMLSMLLASIAVAVACPGQTSPDTKSSALPFTITISGPAEVKTGSGVEVRVKITNTSTREIDAGTFYVDGVDTGYTYDVRDSAGNPAQKKNMVMSGSIRLARLKPGESVEKGTLVSRIFDMTHPGQYEIQLSRAVGGPKDPIVKSNKVTVTITP
jgi:hypothetical protein